MVWVFLLNGLLVLATYPFTTSKGAPTCQVENCEYCVKDTVEYSPEQKYPQYRHVLTTTTYLEKDIHGHCCGNHCSDTGDTENSGYGECWDSGGWSWCGLCENAKCNCRRLSFEIIPHECQKCLHGFALDGKSHCLPCPVGHIGKDGISCTPVDKCQERTDTCSPFAICLTTGPGTYKCTCKEGYEGNGQHCEAFDNCARGPLVSGCDPDAVCTVTGARTNSCTCPQGFQGNGQFCQDIDECTDLPTNPCGEDQYCINTLGSYQCGQCHPHCAGRCRGEGAEQCDSCRNVKDGYFCTEMCPQNKYPDSNRDCQLCHPQCDGCFGANSNQCLKCKHTAVEENGVLKCVSECPVNHYTPPEQKHVCKACSSSCPLGSYETTPCSAVADRQCSSCPMGYQCSDGRSKQFCAPGTFADKTGSEECAQCPPGSFCQGGFHQEQCWAGQVAPFPSTSTCHICGGGLTHNAAHTACVDIDECATGRSFCLPSEDCVNRLYTFECVSKARLTSKEKKAQPTVVGLLDWQLGLLIGACCLFLAIVVWVLCHKKCRKKPERKSSLRAEEEEWLANNRSLPERGDLAGDLPLVNLGTAAAQETELFTVEGQDHDMFPVEGQSHVGETAPVTV